MGTTRRNRPELGQFHLYRGPSTVARTRCLTPLSHDCRVASQHDVAALAGRISISTSILTSLAAWAWECHTFASLFGNRFTSLSMLLPF